MDVERTIEFILETQAKTEARLEAITKLMQQGVAMLVKADGKLTKLSQQTDRRFSELAQAQKELAQAQKRTDARLLVLAQRTDASLAELAQAQKETQRSLKALLDSLRHPRDGRNR